MNQHSRSIFRWLAATLAALVISMGIGGTPCSADFVQFDPFGTGGDNAVTIGGLDWSPGNAIAIGGNQAVSNFATGEGSTDFELRYQATLAGYLDTNGNTIGIPGLNQDFQITVVARFFETVTSVSDVGTSGAMASFATSADQTGSYLEIYYNDSATASNLAGTGFQDGTRILAGTVTSAEGSFLIPDATKQANFDGFGDDDYNGLLSVIGLGSAQVAFDVDSASVDTGFFLLPPLLSAFFNTYINTPFTDTDPSGNFTGHSPELGSVNGAPVGLGGGPDVQFMADGTVSLTAVPEPSSAVLVALGVVGVLGFQHRRRRARNA